MQEFYGTQVASTVKMPTPDELEEMRPKQPDQPVNLREHNRKKFAAWIKKKFRISNEPYVPPTFPEMEIPPWTKTANHLLEYHTTAFSCIYFGMRTVTLFAITGAIHSTTFFQGAEWAAGWVFARFTAKWR